MLAKTGRIVKIMKNNFMITYTGKKVNPFDMKLSDIDILDIAHALSNKCRYGGHGNTFLSVAEHCVLFAYHMFEGPPIVRLLHDAGEAYLPDILTGIKENYPLHIAAENNIMYLVRKKFSLPKLTKATIKAIHTGDVNMRYWEGRFLGITHPDAEWMQPLTPPEPKVSVYGWPPYKAETVFLGWFKGLGGSLSQVNIGVSGMKNLSSSQSENEDKLTLHKRSNDMGLSTPTKQGVSLSFYC